MSRSGLYWSVVISFLKRSLVKTQWSDTYNSYAITSLGAFCGWLRGWLHEEFQPKGGWGMGSGTECFRRSLKGMLFYVYWNFGRAYGLKTLCNGNRISAQAEERTWACMIFVRSIKLEDSCGENRLIRPDWNVPGWIRIVIQQNSNFHIWVNFRKEGAMWGTKLTILFRELLRWH